MRIETLEMGRMRHATTFVLFALLASAAAARAQAPAPSPAPPQFGPARGTLVIVGGGLKSEAIRKRFVDLAGGPEASLVMIPTAGESDDPGVYAEDVRDLLEAGARHV